MAERHGSSIGIITRSSLCCLFSIVTLVFLLSWFFVLCSTETELFPNSKVLSSGGDGSSVSSIGNREIVVDDNRREQEKKSSIVKVNENLKCDTHEMNVKQPLKVFMYDLPPEFHFGLLNWKQEGSGVWPDIRTTIPAYPGGLNLQHSIEYWLTLDLLASEYPFIPRGGAAVRVRNASEADVIFVPFFSSLCYNRFSRRRPHETTDKNRVLQDKIVELVTSQPEWKKSGGRDHIILAHHPNSMLTARSKLWSAMFILADFGRYPLRVANVDKDVVAPYKHVIGNYVNDSSDFDSRPTLLYFQGAIYRKDGGIVRQELFYLLKDEKDVHFQFGSIQKDGISRATEGMRSSKFCLNIAGDTPSSNRLFDAIASHCVPVIISDEIELPYEDVLDYSEFCIFIPASDAVKENFVLNLVRGIKKDEWTRMWRKLQEVEKFFQFNYPSKEGDAVQMIWQAVAKKVPAMKLKVHKYSRFSQSGNDSDRELKISIPSPKNFW